MKFLFIINGRQALALTSVPSQMSSETAFPLIPVPIQADFCSADLTLGFTDRSLTLLLHGDSEGLGRESWMGLKLEIRRV